MLYSFKKDGGYGFVDDRGDIVIQPVYDEAEEFRDGVAAVKIGNSWGLIDEEANILIPFEYYNIFPYGKGWVHAEKENTQYLFTTAGEKILEITGILAWYFPEDGLIRVKKQTGWGCIDMKGNTIIPFQYISLGPCRNGQLSFYENNYWGWLNKKGEVIVPAVYKEVGHWNETYWWCRNQEGYLFLDYHGNPAPDQTWMKILLPVNGTGAVKSAAGWRYIDSDLKTVLQLEPVYEWVEHFSEGLAAVKKDGKWGFIDTHGREVIPAAYSRVEAFREGLAVVQKEQLWGYMDTSGSLVIPCMFQYAGPFKNGIACVGKDWYEWDIDRQGRQVSATKIIS